MGALDCVMTGKMQPTESTEVFAISMSSNSTLNEPRRDLESQATKDNGDRRPSIWWKLLIDLPLLIIVVVLVGLFELGVIPSYQAGFFCNDPALSFPFRGDTVSTSMLVATVFLAPLVVLLATELLFTDTDFSQRAKTIEATKKVAWMYRSYFYGMIFNFVVIEVMKGISGSPRPTFFDICQPDALETICKDGNTSKFVSSFKCTSTRFSRWIQEDSYHSFPSGHTSLSVHCGLFIAWYLQKRAFNWQYRTIFLTPVLQLLFLTFAAISSLTRITDHRHHWWDVLTGFVIGVVTFLYSAVLLCQNFTTIKTTHITEDPRLQQSVQTLIFDTRRSELPTP